MSIPPYIPGVVAVIATTAAALTPSDADGMTEVGFLRWAMVALVVSGGGMAWKLIEVLQAITRAIESLRSVCEGRAGEDHKILTDLVRDTLKP